MQDKITVMQREIGGLVPMRFRREKISGESLTRTKPIFRPNETTPDRGPLTYHY